MIFYYFDKSLIIILFFIFIELLPRTFVAFKKTVVCVDFGSVIKLLPL